VRVALRQRQQTHAVQHLHDALHFDLRESLKRHVKDREWETKAGE
jgi:hypothetical protein